MCNCVYEKQRERAREYKYEISIGMNEHVHTCMEYVEEKMNLEKYIKCTISTNEREKLPQ